MTFHGLMHRSRGAFATLPAVIERWTPMLIIVSGTLLALAFGDDVERLCNARKWQFGDVYGAVFNFAAIVIGGLFAAYALLVVDTTSTLRRVRRTRAFNRFLSFVRAGIGLSILLSFVSVPLVVIKPSFLAQEAWEGLVAELWAGLTLAMLVSVLRLAGTVRLITEDADFEDGCGPAH